MRRASPDRPGGFNASCFVLAGGTGERLRPLTLATPKPLLAFGAVHSLLDFTLSNVRHSGLPLAYVLSQYRHEAVGRHLRMYYCVSEPHATQFVNQPPTSGKRYRGTADAVARNMDILRLSLDDSEPVLVLSADHVYRMDYRKLLAHHVRSGAGVTVAAVPVPLDAARQFGVLSTERSGRILSFEEKPENPAPFAAGKDLALASMGVYVFNRWILRRALTDLGNMHPALDFGRDVVPWMVERDLAGIYQAGESEDSLYWRDVGTLAAYYEAHAEFIDGRLGFDTFDPRWPVHSIEDRAIRASCAHGEDRSPSVIATSAVLGDCRVERSVVGVGAVIEDGAEVCDSVVLAGVSVGCGAAVRNAIVAEGANVEARDRIGFNPTDDLKRFGMSPTGIVIVPPSDRERTEIVSDRRRQNTESRRAVAG